MEQNQEINAVVLGQEFGAQMKALFDKDIESYWKNGGNVQLLSA